MRRLDDATAAVLGGEAKLLVCVAWACCYLIAACERIRDVDRAGQWCTRVGEFCEPHGIGLMLGFCRAHYGAVITSQGRWEEAERELRAAADDLASARPPAAGDALVRLGELRRRQGRLDEAEKLFTRCEGHVLTPLYRGVGALDAGRPDESAELADRYLRRFPDRGRAERWAGLELAARAQTALGNRNAATAAIDELREIAARVDTRPVRAAVLSLEGTLAAASGEHDQARRWFEDALDVLVASEAPPEAARTRLELAATLHALGREPAARREIEVALATCQTLGAAVEASRAQEMLARYGARAAHPAEAAEGPLGGLSRRELEVLALVAEGLTNQEIAAGLVISDHTVHRDLLQAVVGVREKLGRRVVYGELIRTARMAGAERCRIDELTGLALPDSVALNAGKFHFASGFQLVQTVRDYDVARCVAEAGAPYRADAPAVATV
jgi:LuxR family transcriptional regulator, maltose regulon positive regulatory protein